MLLMSVSV